MRTWSCFPQMTCVGALILLMFSWRECLDFSSTISKNTKWGQEESQSYKGDALPSLLTRVPAGQPCHCPLSGIPRGDGESPDGLSLQSLSPAPLPSPSAERASSKPTSL